jgi:hypothetical protein
MTFGIGFRHDTVRGRGAARLYKDLSLARAFIGKRRLYAMLGHAGANTAGQNQCGARDQKGIWDNLHGTFLHSKVPLAARTHKRVARCVCDRAVNEWQG